MSRREALREQVRAFRPDLDRAGEIAAKADAENRAMTPEEKAVFDPIIAKAKDINSALKADPRRRGSDVGGEGDFRSCWCRFVGAC